MRASMSSDHSRHSDSNLMVRKTNIAMQPEKFRLGNRQSSLVPRLKSDKATDVQIGHDTYYLILLHAVHVFFNRLCIYQMTSLSVIDQ